MRCLLRPRDLSARGRRAFATLRRGNDEQAARTADVLGLDMSDLEAAKLSPQRLRAVFKQRARFLRPGEVPGDDERLQQLLTAYKRLRGDTSVRYVDQQAASIDLRLGILREGARVFGNHNPEHQNLDHLLMGAAHSADTGGGSFGDAGATAFASVTGQITRADDDIGARTAPPPRPGEVLRPEPGRQAVFVLKLAFEEAAHGCRREITYDRKRRCAMCHGSGRQRRAASRCPQCHGRGAQLLPSGTYEVRDQCSYCMGHGKVPPPLCGACGGHCVTNARETFIAPVPAASTNGTELRFKGRGDDGKRGGPPGDLVVALVVSEHRLFHAIGPDLHAVVPLSLTTALLGGVVQVPTLLGRQSLRVPPRTESGDILTLHGHGIDGGAGAHDADRPAGHMHYHAVVLVPAGERLTARQRNVLAAFGELPPEALQPPPQSPTAPAGDGPPEADVGGSYADACARAKSMFRSWLPTTPTSSATQ